MPENEQNNVIPLQVRVQGLEQARAVDVMGLIVTWEPNNSECRRESITAAFTLVGMADLAPEERSSKQALRAALSGRFSKKNRRVAPAEDGYDVSIEHPIPGQRRVRPEHVLSAWIEYGPNGEETVMTDVESFELDGTVYSRGDLEDWVEDARKRVDTDSISSALVKAGARLKGISMRSGGGAYWLPRGSIGRWMELKEALDAAGRPVIIGSWENKAGPISIESTINSVAAHVDRHCDDLLAKLAECTTVRGIDTKTAEAVELIEQIAEYEKVLGLGLEELKAKAIAVKTATTQAAMIVTAEKEARARARAASARYQEAEAEAF